MKGLTRRQRMVLDVINKTMSRRGYPPTIREIGEALGIRSTNGVNDHLKALEKKGYVLRDKSKSRGIRLPGDVVDPLQDADLVSIPLMGRIAAGAPILADENREATYHIDRALLGTSKPHDVFVLKVRGESMIGDGIFDSDLIFVERCSDAKQGEIVAAMVDGEATVKRFFRENGHIRLEPSNPTMEPLIVTEADGRDTAIIGRVIGVFRQV